VAKFVIIYQNLSKEAIFTQIVSFLYKQYVISGRKPVISAYFGQFQLENTKIYVLFIENFPDMDEK